MTTLYSLYSLVNVKCNVIYCKWLLFTNRPLTVTNLYVCCKKHNLYSTSTDLYLDYLVTEEGSKGDLKLHKAFQSSNNIFSKNYNLHEIPTLFKLKKFQSENITDLVKRIELHMTNEKCIPNSKLYFLLNYFVKVGNTSGVKAIQSVVKNNNTANFQLNSNYNHYLAEALWVNGKIEESLKLFTITYSNEHVRPKVVIMLRCLFPILITQHSEVLVNKIIKSIEQFSIEKNDFIILMYIWKELFESEWFSDQKLSTELLERNVQLLNLIQFIIPTMGKVLLAQHKIQTFNRLLEFTIEKELKQDTTLIQLLFDYYCKYCSSFYSYKIELVI